MIPVRKVVLPVALACATVLVPTTAAAAAEPEKSGWWNRASAGGVAAPAPTAMEGDLRVAALGPDEPAAYAAVLYNAPGSPSATLDVELRSLTGTPEIVACPTQTTDWPEGGNQPYDQAPPFDCEVGLAFGSLSEDGTTLSFLLDSTTQTEPGVWSLALVPQPGSTSGPFLADIAKPGPQAFQAAPPEMSTDTGSVGSQAPSADTTTASGSGDAFLSGGFAPPPALDVASTETPLLAGGADVVLPQPAAPTVAGGSAPVAAPLILARPAGIAEDLGSGRRLLALLVLAGGSAAVGYAAGQQRPGPRLLGGRSRLVPAAGLAAGSAAAGGALPAEERPRGIGRFAKARDAAPRRLR